MKLKCGKCKKVWDIKEMLYEDFFRIYKCPKCMVFTPLIRIDEEDKNGIMS